MSLVALQVVEDRLSDGALLRIDGGVALTQWRLLRDDAVGPVEGLVAEWLEEELKCRRLFFPASSLASAEEIVGGWNLLADDGKVHEVECVPLESLSGMERRLVLALYYAESNALSLWRSGNRHVS
ncbi:hypothetical protein [Rugamonas aquatica]|uniref:Uncharacterized protein n=1 Tax=Rugamonas aquatica TaxID=2743357 RepID=A0A6A7N6R5_9BURK|nr:hypothetical protein [Rugamonas aquatica]MQA40611.1 hypothetical protein [Rugamonas aquatica]